MRLIEHRLKKLEAAIGDQGARYVVYVAPVEDTPASIDAAVRQGAKDIGVPRESVGIACLFLPNDYREIKFDPNTEFAFLSDRGAMGQILAGLDGKDTGLPIPHNA